MKKIARLIPLAALLMGSVMAFAFTPAKKAAKFDTLYYFKTNDAGTSFTQMTVPITQTSSPCPTGLSVFCASGLNSTQVTIVGSNVTRNISNPALGQQTKWDN